MIDLVISGILLLTAILVPIHYQKKRCKRKTEQSEERHKIMNEILLREGGCNEEEKKENSR
jgi:hypothetical protein